MQTFVCFFCKNGIFHHLLMHSIHLFCINAFFKKKNTASIAVFRKPVAKPTYPHSDSVIRWQFSQTG